MILFALFVAGALAQSALTFTGDVEKDFQGQPGVVTVIDLLDLQGRALCCAVFSNTKRQHDSSSEREFSSARLVVATALSRAGHAVWHDAAIDGVVFACRRPVGGVVAA